jgi:pimeloyl-ACP methyl ester carboxylesterase
MSRLSSLPIAGLPARPGHARHAGDDYGVSDKPDWREVDWPAVQHRTSIAGSEVNYVDIGDDRSQHPIVFIHGLGGQWQNFLENIPRFAQHRRVVAPDLPGFGASEMPSEKITIGFYARVVAELLDRLELGPCVVVGNSMGGYVSAELAIQRPELVERLVLVAAAGVSQMDVAKQPVIAAAKAIALATTMDVARLRATARRSRLRHAALAFVARHPAGLKGDLAFEGFMSGTGRPGFEPALRANLEYDFRDRLPDIGCPTLVVWGEKDLIIPLRDADKFVELIEGSRKIVMEDTGHVSMAERPVTFNDHLEEFLTYQVSEGELEGEIPSTERASLPSQ